MFMTENSVEERMLEHVTVAQKLCFDSGSFSRAGNTSHVGLNIFLMQFFLMLELQIRKG
jgi:hypothetical protein